MDKIRSVARVLSVLRAMNIKNVSTLHELHYHTALPKSTIFRLLATLVQEGYVIWEEGASIYRLTSKVKELSDGYTEDSRIVDLAKPILLKVTREIKWPLALGFLDRDAIVVRFSSMPYSPLAISSTTLGYRLGLTNTAMGRVYLAFCSDIEREAIFDHIVSKIYDTDALRFIRCDLRQVIQAGYALRFVNAMSDSSTLAVPVQADASAFAVLSMTTFGNAMTNETIERHLPILINTAKQIEKAVKTVPGVD